MRCLAHHPLAEWPQTETVSRLRGRGCAGETLALSFSLEGDARVEIRSHGLSGSQAWVVHVWEQPGLGLYRGETRSYPELLLKSEGQPLQGQYRWKRPGGLPWRPRLPYYEPPSLRLEGAPCFEVRPEGPRQVWVSVVLPASSGLHQGEIEIFDIDLQVCLSRLPVELEVLPVALVEPGQDRLLWYRGTLDERDPQHCLSATQMEAQLRDIRAHGFCSLTLGERTRRNAQKVIDLAEKVGFDRHVLVLAPYPRDLFALRFRRLTPIFYLSDELDGHEPEVLQGHLYNLAQVRKHFGPAQTMASLLSPGSLALLEQGLPDVISFSVTNSTVLLHSLAHFREQYPRPLYYYWACHLEKPSLNRLLAGLALWHSQADGISPYCYQHLPQYPGSPFRDQDPWEADFRLGGKTHDFRQHMTTYPARQGVIPTVQWEGFREGMRDLRYLSTWEELLLRIQSRYPEPVKKARRALAERLHDFDLRLVEPGNSQREPLPNFQPESLDAVRDHVIEDILRLSELQP